MAIRFLRSGGGWANVIPGPVEIAKSHPTYDGPTADLAAGPGEVAVRIVPGSVQTAAWWAVGPTEDVRAYVAKEIPRLMAEFGRRAGEG